MVMNVAGVGFSTAKQTRITDHRRAFPTPADSPGAVSPLIDRTHAIALATNFDLSLINYGLKFNDMVEIALEAVKIDVAQAS
jgi:hypothetical protein